MMLSRLIGYIFDHYRIFLWCLVLLFVSSIYCLVNLKVDNSIKVWFDENDEAYQTFIEFQDNYGNDDIITIMISYPETVFSEKAITEMLQIEKELSTLNYVDEIYSYGSSEYLVDSSSELLLQKVVTTIPINGTELQQIKARMASFPLVKQTFISEDEQSHIIVIRLSSFEDIELKRDNIVRDLQGIIDRVIPSYQLAGMAVLNEALNTAVSEESALFSLLNYLALLVLLFLIVKKRRYIFLVLPAIALPTIFTFGLFALTNQSLNLISITLPTILMVYALADVVHIINNYIRCSQKYPDFTKRELVVYALNYSFKPCMYASVTTMLAYVSFYLSPLEVLTVTGLFAFIGLGLAFVSVYIISIIGFAILKIPQREKEWAIVTKIDNYFEDFSTWITAFTKHRKYTIILVFSAIFITGLILLPKVDINAYPGEYLDDKSVVRRDSKLIEDKMGAYLPFELIIRSNDDQRITSKNNLIRLELLQKRIEDETRIYTPFSLVEIVKYMNQQLSSDGDYSIPNSDRLISQFLLLYEMEEDNRLSQLTNINYSEARITGKVRMLSVNDYMAITKEVGIIFNEVMGESHNLTLIPQGYIPLYIKLTKHITTSLLYSFLGAFIMILITMWVFIRNLRLTVISLMANLIPIAFIVILLVWFNIPVDAGTVMIAAIMLGIAVDDTMHLVHAYSENRKRGFDEEKSIDQALLSTNKALSASSIALTIGFLILGLSSVNSLQNFGNLCAAAVSMTFIADIFLVPSLIKALSTRRPNNSI